MSHESRERDGFEIDEEPLRQWILKSYHEKREGSETDRALLDAVREFLSGPAGGESAPTYYFEAAPARALALLADRLENISEGLTSAVLEPLLQGLDAVESRRAETGARGRVELAPNLSVYVASLAGSIALKKSLDETIVCALISAMLLALARLGRQRVELVLKGEP